MPAPERSQGRGRLTGVGDAVRSSSPADGCPETNDSRTTWRTCVGCRGRDDRSVLLRVVAERVDGLWSVVPDPCRVRPGRGASLHLDQVCLDAAERRRAFSRALRRSEQLDLTALRAYVIDAGHTAEVRRTPSGRSNSPERSVHDVQSSTTVRAGSGSEADEHPMSAQL